MGLDTSQAGLRVRKDSKDCSGLVGCQWDALYPTPEYTIWFSRKSGTLDEVWGEPSRGIVYLEDWVRVLKGHPSVDGIILGNEVGPLLLREAEAR